MIRIPSCDVRQRSGGDFSQLVETVSEDFVVVEESCVGWDQG